MRGFGRERRRSWKSKKDGDKDRNIYSTGVKTRFQTGTSNSLSMCPGGEQAGI